MLDKEMISRPQTGQSKTVWDFITATQNSVQLKTYKFFISGILNIFGSRLTMGHLNHKKQNSG